MATATKINRLLEKQNSAARKVYECVPAKEPWLATRVVSEMRRRGFNMEHKVVAGCFKQLKRDGLIKEPSLNTFVRVAPSLAPVEPISPTKPEEKRDMAEPQKETPKEEAKDPIDRLGDIAYRFRGLADELDNVAISLQERDEKTEAKLSNARQLTKLLKSLEDEE